MEPRSFDISTLHLLVGHFPPTDAGGRLLHHPVVALLYIRLDNQSGSRGEEPLDLSSY